MWGYKHSHARAGNIVIRASVGLVIALLTLSVVVAGWEQTNSNSARPATDVFLLAVAVLIGMSIGLALPFFLELARCDIPSYDATSAASQQPGSAPKYREELVDEIMSREFVRVNCLGNRDFEIQINQKTTVADVVKELKGMLDLTDAAHDYCLFVRCSVLNGQGDLRFEDKTLVHRAMLIWENRLELHFSKKGPKFQAQDIDLTEHYSFVFNVFAFSRSKEKISFAEYDFHYENAVDAVLRRRIPCSNKDLVELAALRLQSLLGDCPSHAKLPSTHKVHPAQIDHSYTPLDTSPLDGSGPKTLPKAVKKRYNGKTRAFVLTKISHADMELMEKAILSAWTSFKGVSTESATHQYMELVKQWAVYPCAVYDVTQTRNLDWPTECWVSRHIVFHLKVDPPLQVCVRYSGLSVHERHNRVPLATYPNKSIKSFGALVSRTFKVEVEGGQIVEFIPKQVQEIARLMNRYISNVQVRS
eukprot:m.153287 g.153287  ORF g.153287 m.153287 type:complete len:474 (+) comp15064_c0_seq8:159-1580(+)